MNGQILDRIKLIVGGLFAVSVLFSPDFKIINSLPVMQLPDLLIPIMTGLILLSWKEIRFLNYYLALALFVIAILVSMAVNGRLFVIQDLFEIYKIFKFGLAILFFTTINIQQHLYPFAKGIFICLVGANMIHFFNLFNFNVILTEYYNGGLHIEYFGLNSLKEPAVKRMVGLTGNPNINALVFTFFAILFFPFKWEKEKLIWFFTATLMVLLCQSRTAILSLMAILIIIAILKLSSLSIKNWALLLSGMTTMYLLSWDMTTSFFKYPLYSNLLFNGELMGSGSTRGRLEAWTLIGDMILQKPIFGYGGYKEYFYEHKIFSENEFLLISWRYGLVGLGFFLFTYYRAVKDFMGKSSRNEFAIQILSIVVLLVASLTNNPLSDRTINLQFAIILGIGYQMFLQMKTHDR